MPLLYYMSHHQAEGYLTCSREWSQQLVPVPASACSRQWADNRQPYPKSSLEHKEDIYGTGDM